jgi:hypothetical protein
MGSLEVQQGTIHAHGADYSDFDLLLWTLDDLWIS